MNKTQKVSVYQTAKNKTGSHCTKLLWIKHKGSLCTKLLWIKHRGPLYTKLLWIKHRGSLWTKLLWIKHRGPLCTKLLWIKHRGPLYTKLLWIKHRGPLYTKLFVTMPSRVMSYWSQGHLTPNWGFRGHLPLCWHWVNLWPSSVTEKKFISMASFVCLIARIDSLL